ncbi:MAG TPA: hypothetical protein VHD56_01035 [Tepidisphaeraceae bacterium]|nr:hypothetical protein [Tepidisphaeraceae bacterium]
MNNDTDLVLSVLYDELYAEDGTAQPNSSASGTDLSFAIRTFWPQRQSVSEQLLLAAGIEEAAISQIVNPQVLKRPCVLGTLQMIYTGLAATSSDPEEQLTRADLYERLYRRALRAAILEIDTDGDGVADVKRSLGVVELRRA